MHDFDLMRNTDVSVDRENHDDKRPNFTTRACDVFRAAKKVLENPVLANVDPVTIKSDMDSNSGLHLQHEFTQVLDDLQRSNHRPAPHHTVVLKSLMEQGHSELSTINQSISQLQQHIDEMMSASRQLRDLRRQKLKKIEYYRSWLCTARLLPLDILVSIFKVQRGLDVDNNDSKVVNTTAVSRRLAFWFGRSGSTIPLSLTMSMSNTLCAGISHDVLRAMAMPLLTSRLTTIYLYMTDRNAMAFRPFLSHPGGLFTALETLVLVDETRWEPKDRPNPDIAAGVPRISVFNNSPKLRSLTIRTNQPLLGPKAPQFPWAQLVRLEVQSPTSFQEFIVSLTWCHRHLRTAIYHSVTLGDRHEIEGYPLPDTPITFGRLLKLKVTMSGMNRSQHDLALAISLLRVPSVQILALRTLTWLCDKFPIEGVLLSPSGVFPPLRELSLYHPDVAETDDFIQIFVGCPQLEALSLRVSEDNTDADGLLSALTIPDGNLQPFLPHLTAFSFIFEGNGILDRTKTYAVADVFGALLASRTRTSINSRPALGGLDPLSKASLYIYDLGFSDKRLPPQFDQESACNELRETIIRHGDLKRASEAELELDVDMVHFPSLNCDDVM
ncbi:hypothetical protein H0H92_001979 [Tricholoma furcatifolium]|nr:hypothetical protein H0H92_001979 [Tricholoma furcatifolium]